MPPPRRPAPCALAGAVAVRVARTRIAVDQKARAGWRSTFDIREGDVSWIRMGQRSTETWRARGCAHSGLLFSAFAKAYPVMVNEAFMGFALARAIAMARSSTDGWSTRNTHDVLLCSIFV